MQPATPYASSKLAAEWHVRGSLLRHAIFRLFNVYGPGDPPGRYRNAIPNMMKSLAEPNGRVLLFGDGATRDFTYVERAIDVLARPEPAAGRTVNVGTGVETPMMVVAKEMLRLFDLPEASLHVVERRAWDRVVRRFADVTELEALYGAAVPLPMHDGLARTAEWLGERGYIARRPR
jgi:nucleoside-diphosphate-sugar epimerase